MLVIALFLSAILLLVANHAAGRRAYHVVGFLAFGVALIFLLGLVTIFLPPVALQFVLMTAAMLVWRAKSKKASSFLGPSLLATAAAYGVALYLSLTGDMREYARLGERFPYQSMEARLPAPHSPAAGMPPSRDTNEQMTLLEDAVQKRQERYIARQRANMLRRLHEEKVALFLNSSGFGVARMSRLASERGITYKLRSNDPVLQPASPAPPSGSAADPPPRLSVSDDEGLSGLHREGLVDFVYPVGFGYVKDRRHVAGFQAHRFSGVPGPEALWEVWRLDLVGLLVHDKPVVYVSENLPSMDQLRGAPTRPLDGFEAAGLEKLRRGEYLIAADVPGALRMLGAIRSVKQCVDCHGGERGDLLGAFSYTLRRGEE